MSVVLSIVPTQNELTCYTLQKLRLAAVNLKRRRPLIPLAPGPTNVVTPRHIFVTMFGAFGRDLSCQLIPAGRPTWSSQKNCSSWIRNTHWNDPEWPDVLGWPEANIVCERKTSPIWMAGQPSNSLWAASKPEVATDVHPHSPVGQYLKLQQRSDQHLVWKEPIFNGHELILPVHSYRPFFQHVMTIYTDQTVGSVFSTTLTTNHYNSLYAFVSHSTTLLPAAYNALKFHVVDNLACLVLSRRQGSCN